jgi:hypothetical protein
MNGPSNPVYLGFSSRVITLATKAVKLLGRDLWEQLIPVKTSNEPWAALSAAGSKS